jgi:hypothetical protein
MYFWSKTALAVLKRRAEAIALHILCIAYVWSYIEALGFFWIN